MENLTNSVDHVEERVSGVKKRIWITQLKNIVNQKQNQQQNPLMECARTLGHHKKTKPMNY